MPKIERFCIICDKNVSPGLEDDSFTNPPNGATVWQSHGNYGSALFDPMMGAEYLECFICDECLAKKSSKTYHVKTKTEMEYIFHSFENQLAKEKRDYDEAMKGLTP